MWIGDVLALARRASWRRGTGFYRCMLPGCGAIAIALRRAAHLAEVHRLEVLDPGVLDQVFTPVSPVADDE